MANKKQNQNQHYVPQFILRRFHSHDGRLHVYDKWTRRSFVSSTRNVASEKGFYDFTIDNEVFTLEPMMCEIEDAALGAINAMIDNASLAQLSADEKHAVAQFFAMQMMRTHSARDTLTQMQEGFRNILPQKNLHESQLPPDFFMDEQQLKMSSLLNLRIANELAPHFLNKSWLLNQIPRDCSFFISDNPLVRRNDHPASPLMGNNGLACPGIQIYMPLSPSLTLCFICETLIAPFREHKKLRMAPGDPLPLLDAIDSRKPLVIEPENVVHLNSLQVADATRFLFSSTGDFSLADEMLNANPELANPTRLVVQ